MKCNVCESINFSEFYKGICKCNNCGHCFANLNIDINQLKKIYSKNYFYGEEYLNYLSDKKILQKNFQIRLNQLMKITKVNNKSLLELGSAYGFFLELAKNNFKKIAGVEISTDCINYINKNYGFKIYNTDEFEKGISDRFDVFCLWDVIEHLNNPYDYIKKISKLSNPDSLIAITTGNIDSINSKLFKEKWRLVHPPTHLHYFTPNSIKLLLIQNDFEIIHFEHCGYYRSLGFILHRLNFYKFFRFFLKITNLSKVSLYFNLFDIMFVIAKKRSK